MNFLYSFLFIFNLMICISVILTIPLFWGTQSNPCQDAILSFRCQTAPGAERRWRSERKKQSIADTRKSCREVRAKHVCWPPYAPVGWHSPTCLYGIEDQRTSRPGLAMWQNTWILLILWSLTLAGIFWSDRASFLCPSLMDVCQSLFCS